jgi:hypothetical protein
MTWTADSSGTKTATVAGTVTMTIASPAVVSMTNTLAAGDQVVFTTTGALPTGVTAGTVYYVISSGLSGSQFEFSATPGGAAVNTSGSQSGTHTCTPEHVLDTPSTSATYAFWADLVNMALGDLVELRVYYQVDGSNYRQAWKGAFQHVQINPAKVSPPIPNVGNNAKFTLKQLAGTGRSVPWAVLRI